MRQIVFSCRRGFDHFQGKLHTHRLRVNPLVWISLVRAQLGTDMSVVRRANNAHGATCRCLRVSHSQASSSLVFDTLICSYAHSAIPLFNRSMSSYQSITSTRRPKSSSSNTVQGFNTGYEEFTFSQAIRIEDGDLL